MPWPGEQVSPASVVAGVDCVTNKLVTPSGQPSPRQGDWEGYLVVSFLFTNTFEILYVKILEICFLEPSKNSRIFVFFFYKKLFIYNVVKNPNCQVAVV